MYKRQSENRGREVSHGLNYQKLGKQLMTEDEIAVMDGRKCILQLRGVRPFFSDKYDITKHPNYKYLSDYDKKNTFDMEKHLRLSLIHISKIVSIFAIGVRTMNSLFPLTCIALPTSDEL